MCVVKISQAHAVVPEFQKIAHIDLSDLVKSVWNSSVATHSYFADILAVFSMRYWKSLWHHILQIMQTQ